MEKETNVVSEKVKILSTHLRNITEVMDMYDEIQAIDFGVIDTLNEHTDFITEIQSSLQKEIFSLDGDDIHEYLTSASIYFSNVLNMVESKLSGMVAVAETEGDSAVNKYALKLGRDHIITDELLKEYIEKSVGCYVIFLVKLHDSLDDDEIKILEDEKHLKAYTEFKEAIEVHNEFIRKYLDYDFEKAEQLQIVEPVNDEGELVEFSEEERKAMQDHVVEAINWSNFVNQG